MLNSKVNMTTINEKGGLYRNHLLFLLITHYKSIPFFINITAI